MTLSRRDLVRFFAATAGCALVSARAGSQTNERILDPGRSGERFAFPQGVASADPQPDGIVLWTRVEGGEGDVALDVQVALEDTFQNLVASSEIRAPANLFHTVRVLVTELAPDSIFFYRFIAPDGAVSRIGRTRTAPAPGADRPLKIAVFSCQDYEQGFFSAYRTLILDDSRANQPDPIDFILHVGDYVYEIIRGPETKGWPDLNWNDPALVNTDGSPRRVGPYPSGGQPGPFGYMAPRTIEDYRALYLRYLSDPDLQDARALYPFVQMWDDHETYNDVWQSYEGGRSIADLRIAANQVWFEFIPAALSARNGDDESHHAHDFRPVAVEPRPAADFDDNFLSREPSNLAAIGSLTIYRRISWGRTADLLLMDGRSYRGPKPEAAAIGDIRRARQSRATLPPQLIAVLDAGRTANDGMPPTDLAYLGATFSNPRAQAPRNSMLGERQRHWLKRELVSSEADWKLLGLNVGLMRHAFDDSFAEGGNVTGLYWTDEWDGYPGERRDLMTLIRDENITNVVSLTGDRHMHFAGLVVDDFDASEPLPVAAEFAGGAVSAPIRLANMANTYKNAPDYAACIYFDGDTQNGEQAIQPALNAWMLYGHEAARAVSRGEPEQTAISRGNPAVNPHLRYADSDAFGYFTARFSSGVAEIEFVTIEEPVVRPADGALSVRRRVRFRLPAWGAGGSPDLGVDQIEGARPIASFKTATRGI